jgi:hypothetical protein
MAFAIETYRTKHFFWDWANPAMYHTLSIACFVVFMLVGLATDIAEGLITKLTIIAMISTFISNIILYFTYESLILHKTGLIQITEDHFVIDYDQVVPFADIEKLDLHLFDYKGRYKYTRVAFESNLSQGVQNTIKIHYGETSINRKFLLTEKREIELIQHFISHQIIKDKFTKIHPRALMRLVPKEIRRTEDSRDYVAQKIKSRELNTTEGLLMMSYRSDREAKELRHHYAL